MSAPPPPFPGRVIPLNLLEVIQVAVEPTIEEAVNHRHKLFERDPAKADQYWTEVLEVTRELGRRMSFDFKQMIDKIDEKQRRQDWDDTWPDMEIKPPPT